jgi:flagellar biogenesis protein FliO
MLLPVPLQVLDGFVDFVSGNLIFVGLVAILVLFVFFSYLFVRRTMLSAAEGYKKGRQ